MHVKSPTHSGARWCIDNPTFWICQAGQPDQCYASALKFTPARSYVKHCDVSRLPARSFLWTGVVKVTGSQCCERCERFVPSAVGLQQTRRQAPGYYTVTARDTEARSWSRSGCSAHTHNSLNLTEPGRIYVAIQRTEQAGSIYCVLILH